jgi:TonB family protein
MFAFMNAPDYLFSNQFRHISHIVIALLLCCAPALTGTAFAQSPDLDDVAKHFGKTFQDAQIHTVIVSDFVNNEGRVTLQGVLLADKFWFALLERQEGFRTLNRDRLQMHLYGPKLAKGKSLQQAEMTAARAAGAEVVVTGNIDQDPTNLNINVSALNASSEQKVEQRTIVVPRTQTLDDLAARLVQPDGPTYLVGQNGVSLPACIYCPTPQYTDEARKDKLEGKVVVTAIIDLSGKAQKILEVRGLGDGLTEQAIAVVRQWRFRPARDSKGNAVTVMVPLDVTFRLM